MTYNKAEMVQAVRQFIAENRGRLIAVEVRTFLHRCFGLSTMEQDDVLAHFLAIRDKDAEPR